jgi:hypothetical protein
MPSRLRKFAKHLLPWRERTEPTPHTSTTQAPKDAHPENEREQHECAETRRMVCAHFSTRGGISAGSPQPMH